MGNAVGKFEILLDYESAPESRPRGTILAARAGQCLVGKICIEVKKSLTGVSALVLHMHGKEKTLVGNGKNRTAHDRRFVGASVSVARINGRILEPGIYEYPFSLSLPATLPTSMKFTARSGERCEIKYKLTASLKRTGTGFWQGRQIETKRAFLVASTPIPDSRVPCFLQPATHNIKSMGSFNKGTVTFGVSINDTQVSRGQEVSIAIASRNDSTVNVKALNIKLVEEVIFWSSESHSKRMKEKHIFFERNITGVKWLEKRSRSEVRQSNRDGIELQQARNQEIYEELRSEENVVTLEIPIRARDTYAGRLIEVSHYMEITHVTKSMTNNPKVRIPLRIGYPPEEVSLAGEDRERLFWVAEESLRDIPVAIPIGNPFEVVSSMEPMQASLVEIPPENIIPGGTAGVAVGEGNRGDSGWDNLAPLRPPVVPTLTNLLEEMAFAVNDYEIISQKVDDPFWRPVFSSLTPEEYGSVIAHVNIDFDRPKIAARIAPQLLDGQGLTSIFTIAALRNTAHWNRTAMLQKLLPLCTDLDSGRADIMAELTDWERTVMAPDFQGMLW